MRRLNLAAGVGAIALLAGACNVTAAQAASPLDDLIAPKAGNSACFTRAYDADHLHNNPKQTTTAMVVWLTYDKAYGDPVVLALAAFEPKADSCTAANNTFIRSPIRHERVENRFPSGLCP